MQSSETSSETPNTENRQTLAKRLHAAIESKKDTFPRLVALLGNEIRMCDYVPYSQNWAGRIRFTYKVFGPDEMERAIAWVEAL